jgi:predicted dehydrogenase
MPIAYKGFFDPYVGCVLSAAKLPKFESLQKLLEPCGRQDDIEAVLIATPDHTHTHILGEAVKAGKHVIVEKPVASSADQLARLKDILAEAEERKLFVTTCHPRRYDYPANSLKTILPQWVDIYGPVQRIKFTFHYPHSPLGWKAERSFLLDYVSHELDLMSHLLGESELRVSERRDEKDRYCVKGKRLNDGVHFEFVGSRLREGVSEARRETIEIDFRDQESLLFDCRTGYLEGQRLHRLKIKTTPSDRQRRMINLMADFVKQIRQGEIGSNGVLKGAEFPFIQAEPDECQMG